MAHQAGVVTEVNETLAGALRRWRERLSPRDVGLPARTGRRATGLRREEVADLAGVSMDYVVRLEQGRAQNPSLQVVRGLGRALHLDRSELDHLHRLAGLLPPAHGTVSMHVPPGLARLVARLSEFPLAVYSADWDLLSWSPSWAVLMGDPERLPAAERNLVRSVFGLGGQRLASWPVQHQHHEDEDELHRALVADLRAATVAYPADLGLTRLVADARAGSTVFARLWDTGAVGRHASSRKSVRHPVVGDVDLDCDVLTAPGSDAKLIVYSAATGSPAARALDSFSVTGALGSEPLTTPDLLVDKGNRLGVLTSQVGGAPGGR